MFKSVIGDDEAVNKLSDSFYSHRQLEVYRYYVWCRNNCLR